MRLAGAGAKSGTDPIDGAEGSCVLSGVRASFGSITALDGVDLEIPAGQRVALVGPSGAGKTTLLRLLAGLVRPTTGSVTLAGRSLDELSAGQLPRVVGMMQQRLDLVPQLSVKHNVQAGALGRWGVLRAMAALLLPLESPDARAAAARVGIEQRFHQRVGRLSGGEQQRTALARLLVQDPRILVVDEPVSSLDPARADDLLALLSDLAREGGRTLVASLHAPELARRHFDRIIGLRDGRIAFDLPPGQVTTEVLERVYRLLVPLNGEAPQAPHRRQSEDGGPSGVSSALHGADVAPRSGPASG